MNGILNQITAWNQWQQAGGPIVYDSAFQTSIGGYPAGSIVQIAAGGPEFMSTVDNNTVAPAVGATGWMPVPTFGANVETITSTTTLTAANAGLVIVNAASGNITITMPAVASENATPLPFKFVRIDASSNSVTLQRAGSDNFWPGATTTFSLAANTAPQFLGNGVSAWYLIGGNFGQPTGLFASPGYFEIPVVVSGSIVNLIVNYGSGSITSTGSGVTGQAFTMAKPFTSTGLWSIGGFGGTLPPAADSVAATIANLSQVGLTLYSQSAGTYAVTWLAIGY